MLGGEHKKERFSEWLENAQNQPRNRGYLPGTAIISSHYTPGTLEGNWYEERADASFYDGGAVLPKEDEVHWGTTYRAMVRSRRIRPAENNFFSQSTMVDIVDRTYSSYPGHQPRLDSDWKTALAETFRTTTQESYVRHLCDTRDLTANRRTKTGLSMRSVKVHGRGGTPAAQAHSVLQRLRRQLYETLPGQTPFPGNVIRTLRKTLQESCTDKDDGKINAVELQEGLQTVGLAVSLVECDALITEFACEELGHVAFIETIIGELCGRINERREQLIKSAYNLIQSICDHSSDCRIVRLKDLVRLIDTNYLPNVKKGVLSAQEARILFRNQLDLGDDDESYVSLGLFLRYFRDASFEIDSECEYELWMRNSWHLSGGQGKCSNTSCRRVEVVHHNGRVTNEEVINDLYIVGKDADVEQLVIENLRQQGIEDVKSFRLL